MLSLIEVIMLCRGRSSIAWFQVPSEVCQCWNPQHSWWTWSHIFRSGKYFCFSF